MTRKWILTILVSLLLVGGAVIVIVMPRVVPFSKTSDIYKHYASTDNIQATYIKDMAIIDSVAVDVTLLEAKDSAGWERLKEDFGVTEFFVENNEDRYSHRVIAWRAPNGKPTEHIKEKHDNDWSVSVAPAQRSVCVFHTETDEESKAVTLYKFQNI